MQTILGAGGPIGNLLARELHRSYTKKLRLVSRNPQKLHNLDEIMAEDRISPLHYVRWKGAKSFMSRWVCP